MVQAYLSNFGTFRIKGLTQSFDFHSNTVQNDPHDKPVSEIVAQCFLLERGTVKCL